MTLTPWIIGLEGEVLTTDEKTLIRDCPPAGFILFQRNCSTPEQVKALVASLHEAMGTQHLLVLIDQEGGRVARLKPPHWRKAPPAGLFAAIAKGDMNRAKQLVYLNARMLAAELRELGITVDCAPLADIPVAGSHDIIGDRAYGENAVQVTALATEMARGLMEGCILPVLKHIPGHGRATSDSHEELPTVTASLSELEASDFIPFKELSHLPLGMTAHIRYTALDADRPATLSPTVIRYIREKIGFTGLLMSDDLSMKALSGDLGTLAIDTLRAGCDLVLHCNGKMHEMRQIAKALPPATPGLLTFLADALSLQQQALPSNDSAVAEQFAQLLPEGMAA